MFNIWTINYAAGGGITPAPTDQLIAEYLLAWNALDTSWNWNDWTPSNITYVASSYGWETQQAEFNGTNSTINTNINNISTYADISYACSFTVDTVWGVCSLINNDLWLRMLVNAGDIYCDSRSSTAVYSFVTTPISALTQYIVVLTFKQNWQMKLYLDWVMKSSTAVTNRENADSFGLWLWVDNRTSQTLFHDWKLGLARIYWKELSQSEVNDLTDNWNEI